MNAWIQVDGAWQLAGWTMLHFLWIGAAAGVFGAALRIACRRAAPGVRYAVSLGTLAVIAALPVGIAGWLAGRIDGVSTIAHAESRRDSATWGSLSETAKALPQLQTPQVIDLAKTPIVASPSPAPSEPGRLGPGVAAVGNPSPEQEQTTALRSVATGDRARLLPSLRGRGTIDAAVAYLPWVWIVGAPLTFVLLAAGLVGSKRFRRASTLLDSGPAAEACARLRGLMHITRRVFVAVTDAVAQPVLIGIVRPTILLPAAALSGWSPEELEMVLLHELAHVRRWDNLVNLVQRIVESLLFFHPVVWLASRQVRRDREECCDAAVVRHTERPAEYAELLVAIAGRARYAQGAGTRPAEAGLALASAMADHPLAGRIRRILKLEDESMRVSRGTLIAALTSIGLTVVVAMTLPHSLVSAADESPVATTKGATAQAPIRATTATDAKPVRVDKSQPATRGVQGAPVVDTPRQLELQLPKQMSAEEARRTIKQLQEQGFAVSIKSFDAQTPKSLTIISPDGGDWKPVWETRIEGDKPVKVVRMVRDDVRYQMVGPGVIQVSPGPVPVGERYSTTAVPSRLPVGRKLQPGDQVNLEVVGAFPDRPLTNVYRIEPEGTLALGASYGRVPVAGHTVLEAEELIKAQVLNRLTKAQVKKSVLADVEVQLVLKEPAGDVLIPTAAAPWPTTTPYGPSPTPTPVSGWNAHTPALAEVRPTQVPTWNDYNAPVAPPLTAKISPLDVKKNAKEAEIEEKLSTPVQVDFVETPLVEAVSLLSDTAKVNIYIDPRGIEEEGLSNDVPVSLVLPNEISVKSALKLVLEPLHLTYVIEDEVVKITSETTRDRAAASQYVRPQPAPPVSAPKPQTAPAKSDAEAKPSQQTRYLYDGKEFAQWRSLWQEELKTERRMEAIEALAAFGRAGYGREAVEAVFDVAGQYDFSTMDQSAEGKLKTRVIELLTSYGATRLPETLWLPVLEERLNAEPARWKWLTYWLLGSLQTSDAAVMERLLELAKSEDKDIRAGAIAAIGKSDRKREDPRIIELADKFLGSSNPGEIVTGIMLLEYSPEGNSVNSRLRFRPALVDGLFFANHNVRLTARRALKNIDEKDAAPVVEQLMERLKKSEAKDERLAALRAIAALGPKAATAESALTALIEDYNDLELAAAAAGAVDLLHDGETKDGRVYHPGKDLYFKRIHALGDEQEIQRGNHLFNKESTDMTNSLRNVNRGGGGGSGGGFF